MSTTTAETSAAVPQAAPLRHPAGSAAAVTRASPAPSSRTAS